MISPRARLTVFLGVFGALLSPVSALAAIPGDVFSGFGSGGIVGLDLDPAGVDFPAGIVVQSDGKFIVSVGVNGAPKNRVARYTADGVLDTSFAGDGIAEITIPGSTGVAGGLAVGPDEGIYVASNVGSPLDIAVAKLTSAGALDTTWGGGDGVVTASASANNDRVRDLTIDAAGRLIVAGGNVNGIVQLPTVWRFDTNGVLDTANFNPPLGFHELGVPGDAPARSVDADTQNRILVTFTTNDAGTYDGGHYRLSEGGMLDPGFNSGTPQIPNLPGSQFAGRVVADTDDRVVIAQSRDDVTIDVARYTVGGSLDTSFNGTGARSFSVPGAVTLDVQDVVINGSGDILVTFSSVLDGKIQVGVAKFTGAGFVDTGFGGGDGVAVLGETGGVDTETDRTAVSPDGSIMVASYSGTFPDRDVAVRKVLDRFTDLSVQINPKSIAVDDLGTYNFVVTNSGPTAAAPVTLRVTLPATSSILFNSATSPEGTCSRDGQIVTCTFASLAGNGSAASANIRMQARATGTPTITAVASSALIDPTGATSTAAMELFRRAETSASIRSVTAKGKTRKCGTRTSKACVLTRTKKSFHYVAGSVRPVRTVAAERKLTVRMQINTKGNKWKTVREVAGSTNRSGSYVVRLRGKGLKKGLYRVQTRVPQSARNAAGVSRLVYLRVR